MCLSNARTDNLESINKIAYKTMAWNEVTESWQIPFNEMEISDNKLSATQEIPDFKRDVFGWGDDAQMLDGGAIHCCRDERFFHEHYPPIDVQYEKTFKVRGNNVIAYNENEVAFDEIEFIDPLTPPTSEEIAVFKREYE